MIKAFDEWYGIPRTTDEAFWPSDPAARAAGVAFAHIMEGRKGEKSRELAVYDLDQRRLIDAEITRRTIDFMQRSVQSGKPFYAYVPFTLVHFRPCRIPSARARQGSAISPTPWWKWTRTSGRSSTRLMTCTSVTTPSWYSRVTTVPKRRTLAGIVRAVARLLLHPHGRLAARAMHHPLAGPDCRGSCQQRDRA